VVVRFRVAGPEPDAAGERQPAGDAPEPLLGDMEMGTDIGSRQAVRGEWQSAIDAVGSYRVELELRDPGGALLRHCIILLRVEQPHRLSRFEPES
jgi:hypothetical protein